MVRNDRPMTALDHLRKLLAETPEHISDEGGCRYCDCGYVRGCPLDKTPALDHTPDCPWVAAKAFLEARDETDRLNAPNEIHPANFTAEMNGWLPAGAEDDTDKALARLRNAVDQLELAIDRRDCSPFVPGLKLEDVTIEEGPPPTEEEKAAYLREIVPNWLPHITPRTKG